MCPPADAVIVVSMPINPSNRRPARTTMQAIVQHAYGSTDVLRHQDVDRSTPGRCEVRVRMHAASINQGDWFVTTGRPYVMRAALGRRRPLVAVRGRDGSAAAIAINADLVQEDVERAAQDLSLGGVAVVADGRGRMSEQVRLSGRIPPHIEGVEDEVEPVLEGGGEVEADLGDVPGHNFGEVGELIGERGDLPLFSEAGELPNLLPGDHRGLLGCLERDGLLLEGETVDVGVEHTVGLDRHLAQCTKT